MRANSRFISNRAKWLIWILVIFSSLLLLTLFFVALSSGRYWTVFASGVLVLAAILYGGYKLVLQPFRETEKLLQLFTAGHTVQGIYDLRYPVSPQAERAIYKMQDFMSNKDIIGAIKRQAQYLALQNQINPHFLYNTLEGIRGEAIEAGLSDIAEMTEALAKFFRYTISNMENLVSLEDELRNIKNYYTIQEYRFGDKLSMNIIYDEKDRQKTLRSRLPKLTLQPVVENAIFHGIERKVDRGEVTIKIETTPSRLIILVSDTGIGMEESRLQDIRQRLGTTIFERADDEDQSGIAIVNVNNRIRLLFGEEYGINMYSTPNVGTDVEITVPLISEENQT